MPIKHKRSKWIEINGASEEFTLSVKKVLKQIPKNIISLLKTNGYSILICKTVSSQLSEETKLIHKAPRGWPKGKTWDHLDGIQDEKRIIVSQVHKKNTRWVKSKRMPGAYSGEIGNGLRSEIGM